MWFQVDVNKCLRFHHWIKLHTKTVFRSQCFRWNALISFSIKIFRWIVVIFIRNFELILLRLCQQTVEFEMSFKYENHLFRWGLISIDWRMKWFLCFAHLKRNIISEFVGQINAILNFKWKWKFISKIISGNIDFKHFSILCTLGHFSNRLVIWFHVHISYIHTY